MPSTVLPRVPGPTWRLPATSSWQRARPASSRRSAGWVSIPDAGGTWLLPRLVGEARARGLALLGERITASQAEAWGLIWRCVDDDRLLPEAMATAEQLAQGATRGLALIKQALNASAGNSLDDQLRLESRLQQTAGRTDDYQEGVRAFQEKRAPRFRGT